MQQFVATSLDEQAPFSHAPSQQDDPPLTQPQVDEPPGTPWTIWHEKDGFCRASADAGDNSDMLATVVMSDAATVIQLLLPIGRSSARQ